MSQEFINKFMKKAKEERLKDRLYKLQKVADKIKADVLAGKKEIKFKNKEFDNEIDKDNLEVLSDSRLLHPLNIACIDKDSWTYDKYVLKLNEKYYLLTVDKGMLGIKIEVKPITEKELVNILKYT
ncbi:MAG: hypothetical protein QXP59_04005 [Saccharolobus sp.]